MEGVEKESVGQEEPIGTLSLSEITLFLSDSGVSCISGVFSKGTVSSVHPSSEIKKKNRVGIMRWSKAVLVVGSSPMKFSLGSGLLLISLPEHSSGLSQGVFPTSHPRSSLPRVLFLHHRSGHGTFLLYECSHLLQNKVLSINEGWGFMTVL